MATYERPAGAYDSTSTVVNKDKFQTDSGLGVAISSAKVDGDINFLIDACNQLDSDISTAILSGLPNQTGNADKALVSDGTNASWAFIDTANIATDAVTADKIATGAVGTTEIDSLAVTEAKIGSGAVTSSKIAANGVITTNITDANVTTAKVADDAITLAKMASGTAGNLITYDASGNPAAVATGTAGHVLVSGGTGAAPTITTVDTTGIADDAITLAKLAAGTAGNLITYDASGDPAAVSTGTSGQVLVSNGTGAAPTFQTLSTGVFSSSFTSAEQTITAGGLITVAHSLGSKPSLVQFVAICKTAEQNWSVGDEFIIGTIDGLGASNFGLISYSDATNVNIRIGSAGLGLFNKTTGSQSPLTSANWKIIIKAWV